MRDPVKDPIPDLANRLVAAIVRSDAQYPMIERSIEVRSEVEGSEVGIRSPFYRREKLPTRNTMICVAIGSVGADGKFAQTPNWKTDPKAVVALSAGPSEPAVQALGTKLCAWLDSWPQGALP